ncbi:MAG TPA: GNAT family N-acetyltransferase [Atribacterota bacterium]|nr:GNAT family N-acetyltransferase [Atribacterota bacterium]
MKIIKYNNNYRDLWNNFLKNAKNQTFLFNRNFMDYHSGRFIDYSLIIYNKKGNLICCFPANEKDSDCIVSHEGLAYGAFIFKRDLKLLIILDVIKQILKYYDERGYKKIIYKAFPRIYSKLPCDEVDYALFITKANLIRRDTAIVISKKDRIKYAGNIRRETNKAKLHGCIIEESQNFELFWDELLIPNLNKRFNVNPVHTVDEILLLKSRFPESIKLFISKTLDGELLSGTVCFVTDNVVHFQYIASNDDGRNSGALNYLFTYLIDEVFNNKPFFDFGVVNENNGLYLNKGMLAWKQRMGGRTVSHDFYEINTTDWKNIEQLLYNDKILGVDKYIVKV